MGGRDSEDGRGSPRRAFCSLTCALLASKTENCQTALSDLLQITNPPDRTTIVTLEFTLCQILKFDLKVRHPFLPLHGLYLELKDYLESETKGDSPPADPGTPPGGSSLSTAYAKAKQNADHLMSTDAQLLFTPSQLAWTCLRAAMKETGMGDEWDGYYEHRLGEEAEKRDLLHKRMDEAGEFLQTKLELSPNESARLRDKLAKCMNPLKDPKSSVAKAKREEAAMKIKERQKAKRDAEMNQRGALENVFS